MSQAAVPLLVREEAVSTNDLLWEMYALGERGPAAVMAGRQTGGRGRRGRSWFSEPRGNLYLSALFVLDAANRPLLPFLPLGAALCAARALDGLSGVRPGLKWPNDLVVGDRKVGGVLVESRGAAGDRTIPVVVGIGLNLNAALEEYPAEIRRSVAVLGELAGRRIPVVDTAREVLYNLAIWLTRLPALPGGPS